MAAQQAFNAEVAAALGFDFAAGSIDTTAHPFCSGIAPGDCRLTTRYDESNFLVSLYGVMHEAGHGMYEQGLPAQAHGLPAGTAASLGIHESQSRLWENQVGRAPEFWEVWLGRAAHHFPHLARRTPEEMFAAVNRVRPSFIRVEADQVTYDLHIILRFGLERRIVAGELAIADVPGGVERGVRDPAGSGRARRRARLLAGCPLERGAHRLFPDPTRWATCTARSSTAARWPICRACAANWPPGSTAACWAGCARRCIATARR